MVITDDEVETTTPYWLPWDPWQSLDALWIEMHYHMVSLTNGLAEYLHPNAV